MAVINLPFYIWLTRSKFTCDRLRKQGTTEQVAIIYAASDPKGNDANTLFAWLTINKKKTAVKVSGCFLYDKSNKENLMYFSDICETF